jgi:hypothetical protein
MTMIATDIAIMTVTNDARVFLQRGIDEVAGCADPRAGGGGGDEAFDVADEPAGVGHAPQ